MFLVLTLRYFNNKLFIYSNLTSSLVSKWRSEVWMTWHFCEWKIYLLTHGANQFVSINLAYGPQDFFVWNSSLGYYDTADKLIYSNLAVKPSLWPAGWVCPGLANLFEGGLKPNLVLSSFIVWTEEQTMIFSDQHQFWHKASSGI